MKQPPAGHPSGLYVLFFSEMWERFCYYGMRALLVLYLTDSLAKGDNAAFAVYGAYTALVYAAPVLGGKIADKILGYKNAVILGGVLMAIGEFMILGGTESWLYVGMGAIIVGNGYFKANISSIVGKLYDEGDKRRDSGFTIFYIGINIGALLATLVCAEVGKIYGEPYGFALAGVGMILGVLIFVLGRDRFQDKAQAPNPEKLRSKVFGPFTQFQVVAILSIMVIPVLYLLITNSWIVGGLLIVTAVYVVYNLISEGFKEGPIVRDRMIAMIILFAFNIVFWACFEQAGSSLTLFAKRNVDRMVGTWHMGAATTQFFNPFFILVFGSIFSIMWVRLSKIGRNPNIPMKFGLGIIQLGLGYLVVFVGGMFLSSEYLVPLWTMVFLYLLHTTGELFLSPIGLSMVTKLAPKHLTGTAMGGWFLSFAGANYVAAIIAMATGSGHGGAADDSKEETPPTYAGYITSIEHNYEEMDSTVTRFQNAAKELANKEFDSKEDKDFALEAQEFASSIEKTVDKIQERLNPIVKDTSQFNPIKWTVLYFIEFEKPYTKLTEDYAGLVNNMSSGIKGMTHVIETINTSDASFVDLEEEFGNHIGSYNGAIENIGKITKKFRITNPEYDLSKLDEELEENGKKLQTLAAHITWNIYFNVYIVMGLITVGIGLLLVFISKPINRLMHGVE